MGGHLGRHFLGLAAQRGHAVHPQHHDPAARGLLLGGRLATFALGTALGDFTAISLHLGYLASGIFFGVVILLPALAWRGFG